MASKRIAIHPILSIPNKRKVEFCWNGVQLSGLEGETISSALLANEIHIFGHHHKDGSPQGIFCANGQCSQCMVLVNDIAVKSCMTQIEKNMKIESMEKLPKIKIKNKIQQMDNIKNHNIPVLIIGGGPAGLSAAIELGKLNVKSILIDDKNQLGGKLVLQTHKFFGSVDDSYAGTRGFTIAQILEKKIKTLETIDIWLNSTAVGVFSDGIVGIVKNGLYEEIIPDTILVATGAREKMLSFPGNTLPGVFGAGAFQTIVNRDLVKISNRILIVGGGNVGLITAYHAIQAGIEVVGLIEALPNIGGYKVHSDKLIRAGIPIFTKHTVVSAQGTNHITSVTIAELDNNWQIKNDTYKTFEVDSILIAVGLAKVDEFYLKAKQWGMNVYSAGDAQEIAEASAAIFSGKIEGLKIARALGKFKETIPEDWNEKAIILKSKPAKPVKPRMNKNTQKGVFPVFHCFQEVPCNPCTSVCPEKAIKTIGNKITGLPYMVNIEACKGCMKCVAICPGLAITLVDYRKNKNHPIVTLPHEIQKGKIEKNSTLLLTDINGSEIGYYRVNRVITNNSKHPGTSLIQVQATSNIAEKIVGIQIQEKHLPNPISIYENAPAPDEAIICRCERVTAGEIRKAIRSGVSDLNYMKSVNRVGMGACGSKTCRPMIWKIFQEEGIALDQITDRIDRPLFVEVPMGALAGMKGNHNDT